MSGNAGAGRLLPPRALALVGLPASGKSTVGKALARALGLPFFDLDAEIEARAALPVREIFAAEGEAGFRRRETEALADLAAAAARGPFVLALGGGAVLAEANRAALARSFRTIWLSIRPEAAASRVSGESRPLLAKGDRAAAMLRLFEERRGIYEAVADLVVEVEGLGPRKVAAKILEALALAPPSVLPSNAASDSAARGGS